MNSGKQKPRMQGKKPSHRRAIMQSQLIELIRNERLQSTPSKVRILKQEFDKLVTLAKQDTLTSKRRVMDVLQSEKSVEKLYGKLLPRFADVNSGYTKQAHTLSRKGDNAPQMIIMVRGAEIVEKRSRVRQQLEKQQKSKSKEGGVTSKIKQAVTRATPAGRGSKKIDSMADTRRNSK